MRKENLSSGMISIDPKTTVSCGSEMISTLETDHSAKPFTTALKLVDIGT